MEIKTQSIVCLYEYCSDEVTYSYEIDIVFFKNFPDLKLLQYMLVYHKYIKEDEINKVTEQMLNDMINGEQIMLNHSKIGLLIVEVINN